MKTLDERIYAARKRLYNAQNPPFKYEHRTTRARSHKSLWSATGPEELTKASIKIEKARKALQVLLDQKGEEERV